MKFLVTATMLSFLLGLTCVTTGLAQSSDPVDELKRCATLKDPDARFNCYEELGKQVSGEVSTDKEVAVAPIEAAPVEVAPVAATPVTAEATKTPAPLPDDLGGGQFSDEPEPEKKEYRGLITTCKKGSDGFWYFRFENGQVWKHVNVVRRQYKDCGFQATITEERMGHKMQIDGDDSRVRVTRIR